VSDITERKGAEEAGRESEERYRRLFEVESDAILLLEPDTGRILDANAAALELYGYTRKEFLLLNIFEVSAEPEKTRKVFAERRVRVPLRWHRKKDGTVFPVEIVGNSFLDQGRTNHVAAIRDITERKGGEMALREAELMLRFFVQHAPAAIAMLDREMRYLVVSRRWMTDFQTGDREILGLSHYDVFPEIPEHWKEIHQRCLAGSVENCEEEPFPRLDGRIDWVRWEVRPWRRIDNSIGGIIIFSELITERKRVDAELQRSFDQLRALAAWLQSVREEERKRVAREIHDQLGQALTAIKIELSSLVHELPVGDKPPAKRTSSILQLVDESIRTVRRISTELRPGMLDDLGLVATIEWAGEDFQARTGTTCRLDLPRDDIAVDPEQATAIFRIFQETLTNVARHADATAVEVRLVKEGGELMLKVHDNGKGIPEGKLSASKSLGILGMRERAILLGGELAISSLPGAGTTVRVRIPGAHRAQREQGHG
jgi:PAS domain S-box-containing protein